MLIWQTCDQAIEMRMQRQMAREIARGGRIAIGADPQDKNDQARKDRIDEYGDHEAAKPLDYKHILREQHVAADQVALYVPKDEVDVYRFQDGFQPVLDKDNNPVAYKDQILTTRPRVVQDREDRREVAQSNSRIKAIQSETSDAMKKRLRDANVSARFIPAGDFGLQDDNYTGV